MKITEPANLRYRDSWYHSNCSAFIVIKTTKWYLDICTNLPNIAIPFVLRAWGEKFRKPNFIARTFFLKTVSSNFSRNFFYCTKLFLSRISRQISDLLSTQRHTLMTTEGSIVSTKLKISPFSTDASSELKAVSIHKCCYGCRFTVFFFSL